MKAGRHGRENRTMGYVVVILEHWCLCFMFIGRSLINCYFCADHNHRLFFFLQVANVEKVFCSNHTLIRLIVEILTQRRPVSNYCSLYLLASTKSDLTMVLAINAKSKGQAAVTSAVIIAETHWNRCRLLVICVGCLEGPDSAPSPVCKHDTGHVIGIKMSLG